MADVDFEQALREDLPRGHADRAMTGGAERGLFARWLKPEEMQGKPWITEGGLLLGKRGEKIIGWKDDRHVMTIGGSRGGKGVSLIEPNLMFYEGSALVVDTKGELARHTAARRGEGVEGGQGGLGQDVYVLDPFGVSGVKTSTFNPLAELGVDSPDLIDDATMFADALIVHSDYGDKHWTESAQALLRALILVAVAEEDPERRNLTTVRRLLMLTDSLVDDEVKSLSGEDFSAAEDTEEEENIEVEIDIQEDEDAERAKDNLTELVSVLKKQARRRGDEKKKITGEEALISILKKQMGRYGYVCRGVGEQLAAMSDNERGSVLSSARTQTQWLDSENIEKALSRSDFELADLKRKKTTVYLSLPAMRLPTHARWLRLMILLAITVMERTTVEAKPPVLFVLDEFPILGHMDAIEKAAGLMAGFGVKLWVIVQNVGQLKQHYKDAWQTFFANCGVVTALSVTDAETLETLSNQLGRTAIVEKVRSGASDSALRQGASPLQDDRREVPLLAAHELRLAFGRDKNRVLIFNAEYNPAVVERFIYYKDPMFEGLYVPDPKYAHGKAEE
jgi:type IV secretion system protein VirD4